VWVSTAVASATGATDTIAPAEWGAAQKLAEQGPKGNDGSSGPGLVFRGEYVSSQYYYQTDNRRDVVKYGSAYYITNNLTKNNLNTWGQPDVVDWIAFGAVFSSVATALLLAEDATVTKTLTIGTAGTDHGIIQSANYNGVTHAGWQIKDNGHAEFGDVAIYGSTWSGGTITGAALLITSSLGMRYVSDNGVYTLTGGSGNGVQYGAQIDLQGTSFGGFGLGGVLVLQAGNGTNGRIEMRTDYGGTTGGADFGLTRLTIARNGDVNVARNLDVGLTLTAPTLETTGITTGNGASQRKVLARQPVYAVFNVTGGSTSETIDFNLSNFGFFTRPDAGWMQSADWDRLLIRYDIDDSTSTNAKLRLTMADGSTLPSIGSMEVTGEFVEYD
jgi:hypothetical protein